MTTRTSHHISHHHTLVVTDVGFNNCELTARSPFSGEFNTIEVYMNARDMNEKLSAWKIEGLLIQNAFPTLNADEREFIMTGTPKADWDRYMVHDEDAGDEKEI